MKPQCPSSDMAMSNKLAKHEVERVTYVGLYFRKIPLPGRAFPTGTPPPMWPGSVSGLGWGQVLGGDRGGTEKATDRPPPDFIKEMLSLGPG